MKRNWQRVGLKITNAILTQDSSKMSLDSDTLFGAMIKRLLI